MEHDEAERLVKQLAAGFETLQHEYQKLFGRHHVLERKLATAREQYNELVKLYGSGPTATPPLSLSSASGLRKEDAPLPSASEILDSQPDQSSKAAAKIINSALCASQRLRGGLPQPVAPGPEGVKIWSGPSADPANTGSCMMPSISESPLEQDFTIEGTPSKLGCPFAGMAGKKLSSHAASVLSRYKSGGSAIAPSTSTPLSSISRVNGKEHFSSRAGSHRASFADPIKAEICGLSSHSVSELPFADPAAATHCSSPTADPGDPSTVCPIRFLDQHSPEEVATYFEAHKHELPRSHEVCVKRYQSNEAQIRELDSKYGNLVSMIQGLGHKHQPMLPPEPEDDDEEPGLEPEDAAKVRQWASSVSPAPAKGADTAGEEEGGEEEGDRQPHFSRPLREIRVGESPSRPWGISVPARYLEKAQAGRVGNTSETSSQPARITSSHYQAPPPQSVKPVQSALATTKLDVKKEKKEAKGRCPMGFDKATPTTSNKDTGGARPEVKVSPPKEGTPAANVTFVAPEAVDTAAIKDSSRGQMLFTGPVFIGYSAEDAAKILRDSGLGGSAGGGGM